MYSLCLRDYASDGVSARVTKMHLRSLQCVVQPFNHQHVVRLFLNRHRVQCIVNTSSDNPTPVHTVSILSPISAPPPCTDYNQPSTPQPLSTASSQPNKSSHTNPPTSQGIGDFPAHRTRCLHSSFEPFTLQHFHNFSNLLFLPPFYHGLLCGIVFFFCAYLLLVFVDEII